MSAQSSLQPSPGLAEPPKSVRVATVLMVVVAVLYLLGAILGAVGFVVGGLSIMDKGDQRGEGLAVIGVVVGAVVVAVLVLFLWLTAKVRRGRSWARTVATIVLVVGIVLTAPGTWESLTAEPVVIPVLAVVELVLMVAAVLLLWVPVRAKVFFSSGRPVVG